MEARQIFKARHCAGFLVSVAWSSWLARQAHNLEVGRSSRPAATPCRGPIHQPTRRTHRPKDRAPSSPIEPLTRSLTGTAQCRDLSPQRCTSGNQARQQTVCPAGTDPPPVISPELLPGPMGATPTPTCNKHLAKSAGKAGETPQFVTSKEANQQPEGEGASSHATQKQYNRHESSVGW